MEGSSHNNDSLYSIGVMAIQEENIFKFDFLLDKIIHKRDEISKNKLFLHLLHMYDKIVLWDLFVEKLIKSGVALNILIKDEIPLLSYFAEKKKYCLLELAVKHGADLEIRDSMSQTPLMYISHFHYSEAIQTLLHNSANPNTTDSHDNTPLIIVARESGLMNEELSTKNIRLLLEYGALPNHRNKDGETALISILKSMKFYGHHSGMFNLQHEYSKCHEDINLLLENGADVNLPDNDGRTPIYFVRDQSTFDLLIQAGANLHHKMNNSENILHHFAKFGDIVFFENIIKQIIKEIENEITNIKGVTPFHVAIRHFNVTGMRSLLRGSINVNKPYKKPLIFDAFLPTIDYNNEDLFSKAYSSSFFGINCSSSDPSIFHNYSLEIISVLIEENYDINVTTDAGISTFMFAAAAGDLKILKLLHEEGCDPYNLDQAGRSALFYAAAFGNEKVVKYLLEINLNPYMFDFEGNHPLYYAGQNNHQSVIDLLILPFAFCYSNSRKGNQMKIDLPR